MICDEEFVVPEHVLKCSIKHSVNSDHESPKRTHKKKQKPMKVIHATRFNQKFLKIDICAIALENNHINVQKLRIL